MSDWKVFSTPLDGSEKMPVCAAETELVIAKLINAKIMTRASLSIWFILIFTLVIQDVYPDIKFLFPHSDPIAVYS